MLSNVLNLHSRETNNTTWNLVYKAGTVNHGTYH
nr:MAG TPA: hypothetical protein [Caudoviricetes sp.]